MDVKIVSFEDLPEDYRDQVSDNGCGKDCANYLVISHNDEIISVESDAMESEDATFARDLRWIRARIMLAYKLGVIKGSKMVL